MQITKAGHDYLAAQYEHAVDAGLDIAAIHRHLQHLGIARTPREVVHDLDNVYQFHGYATSHPAPPLPDVAAADLAIQRMTPAQLAAFDPLTSAPTPSGKRVYVSSLARRR